MHRGRRSVSVGDRCSNGTLHIMSLGAGLQQGHHERWCVLSVDRYHGSCERLLPPGRKRVLHAMLVCLMTLFMIRSLVY